MDDLASSNCLLCMFLNCRGKPEWPEEIHEDPSPSGFEPGTIYNPDYKHITAHNVQYRSTCSQQSKCATVGRFIYFVCICNVLYYLYLRSKILQYDEVLFPHCGINKGSFCLILSHSESSKGFKARGGSHAICIPCVSYDWCFCQQLQLATV